MKDAAQGLLHAVVLDGEGGCRPADASEIQKWTCDDGILWTHLLLGDQGARRWLRESAGLDDVVTDTLLAPDVRPRVRLTDRGLLIVLRGVNLNPGEDPEDMVAVRVWIESRRIISIRRRRLLSVQDVLHSLERGHGPTTPGAFIAELVEYLANRIGMFVDSIEENIGDAEELMETADTLRTSQQLSALRRKIASVRRFLSPQRDALDRLYRQPGPLFTVEEIDYLREEADRITRYIEDLDLARERAVVLREEYLGRMAQEQNSRMYVLSVVAAVFLPLTFVTGMLGMNVGGLPGVNSAWGFAGSVVVMIGVTVSLITYFRSKKWL
jgi:zinc transporter